MKPLMSSASSLEVYMSLTAFRNLVLRLNHSMIQKRYVHGTLSYAFSKSKKAIYSLISRLFMPASVIRSSGVELVVSFRLMQKRLVSITVRILRWICRSHINPRCVGCMMVGKIVCNLFAHILVYILTLVSMSAIGR